MTFMSTKVSGSKEEINKANSIANKIAGIVIAVFAVVLIAVVLYYNF